MYQKKCWKIHVIFLLLLSMLLLNACHMPAGSEKTEENIMDERENSEESSIWISINDIPKGYTEIRYVSVPMRQQDCYSNAEGNKRFVVEVQQGDTDLISVEEKRKIEIDGSQGIMAMKKSRYRKSQRLKRVKEFWNGTQENIVVGFMDLYLMRN